ncbi:hypothetical protein [Emergencia sp.]|uniref:hypothetical protein n=1 Tax=Emergencia sp. TaxID=1926557 RepID=UPI003AEFEDCE
MCAMKYYEPDSKAQYKELRKNWKKEMKRSAPQFENHLKEYEDEKHQNVESTTSSQQVIDHEQKWKDEHEEVVTYQIIRQKKQAEFTPKGKRRMIWRNINKFLAIFLTGIAIYIWLPVLIEWL